MKKLKGIESIGRRWVLGFSLAGLLASAVAAQARSSVEVTGKEVKKSEQASGSLVKQSNQTGEQSTAPFVMLAALTGVEAISGAAQDAPPATPPATPDQAAAPATPPAAPAAPTALPTPAMTGPLSGLPPAIFDAGPLGKLAVNGIISGIGFYQSAHVPVSGNDRTQAAVSNGQVFLQKTDTWFQFYLQAGAYNLMSLGTPFLATDKTMTATYGPLPVGFLKLAPQTGGWKNTSLLIGELPTLIGAEYTFSFENMNIERGLLWNQETAISRGIQLNQAMGKFSASVSWNDGFYSNRYTWISGSLAYTKGAHALSFVAGGNAGQTVFTSGATPLQNNGSIYNVIYTFTKGPWIITPYFQYTKVPTNTNVGVAKGTSTTGGAILASYAFKHGFSMAGRWEDIGSSGTATDGSVNLMYGPGSKAWSFTATPTFQYGGFFFRGDLAWVHATDITPGSAFGPLGNGKDQARLMGEIGFIFGNNIVPKTP